MESLLDNPSATRLTGFSIDESMKGYAFSSLKTEPTNGDLLSEH